jgi:hypothetical protein
MSTVTMIDGDIVHILCGLQTPDYINILYEHIIKNYKENVLEEARVLSCRLLWLQPSSPPPPQLELGQPYPVTRFLVPDWGM